MRLYKKCRDTYKQFLRYRKQLRSKVGKLDISIEENSNNNSFDIEIADKNLYKWIKIPIENWNKVKNAVDELLNKEEWNGHFKRC